MIIIEISSLSFGNFNILILNINLHGNLSNVL